VSTHSYCKACGAQDAGHRFEVECDACKRVLEPEEPSATLAVGNACGFTVCFSCATRLMPDLESRTEVLAGGFYPDIVAALKKASEESQ
jgi:hypothetical protein